MIYKYVVPVSSVQLYEQNLILPLQNDYLLLAKLYCSHVVPNILQYFIHCNIMIEIIRFINTFLVELYFPFYECTIPYNLMYTSLK